MKYDEYVASRTYEGRRRSRRRYFLVCLAIIAVFAFCLGVLVGAH